MVAIYKIIGQQSAKKIKMRFSSCRPGKTIEYLAGVTTSSSSTNTSNLVDKGWEVTHGVLSSVLLLRFRIKPITGRNYDLICTFNGSNDVKFVLCTCLVEVQNLRILTFRGSPAKKPEIRTRFRTSTICSEIRLTLGPSRVNYPYTSRCPTTVKFVIESKGASTGSIIFKMRLRHLGY